jgi:hypothetical protein
VHENPYFLTKISSSYSKLYYFIVYNERTRKISEEVKTSNSGYNAKSEM